MVGWPPAPWRPSQFWRIRWIINARYSGQQKFFTSSCTPPAPPPPCAKPPNGIAAPPVFTRAEPVLISGPAVGVRLFESSGFAAGFVGVGRGFTTAVDSVISGAFGGGGASTFGFAIS